jgi:hypothetical protein
MVNMLIPYGTVLRFIAAHKFSGGREEKKALGDHRTTLQKPLLCWRRG